MKTTSPLPFAGSPAGILAADRLPGVSLRHALPLLVLLLSLLLHILVPNRQAVSSNTAYSVLLGSFSFLYALWLILSQRSARARTKLTEHAPLHALSFGR
ncbi:hypothetical protein LJK87_02520 [Paenibacillus sp. P25]|nr:hypothetical protein LJK87_02520 [Paenibacillus sp. P25]